MQANKDIREAISNKRLKHYEVAEKLGISQYTFAHWLQTEMTETKKNEVLKVINDFRF